MKKLILPLTLLFVLAFAAACNESNTQTDQPAMSDGEFEKQLLERLITAEEGAVIEIPEGTYQFKRQLSLNDVKNVTIKGAGMDKTILSFKDQIDGGEGLMIKADGITLEDFTVQDTKGDGIKIQGSENVVMRRVKATWTAGPKTENGGYGLYPVSCKNVLMEECVAMHASDAGIYVGQSDYVIVRNNRAEANVAGIEIENCQIADVYGNTATNNTGGLLIFDMPNLPQANGYSIKVHDNKVFDNNMENFSPDGGVVHDMPSGSGMLVVGHKDVEIFNNEIKDYSTVGIALVSYKILGRKFEEGGEYSPYCSGINVHDNTLGTTKWVPDVSNDLGKMAAMFFQGPVDIIVDGLFDPEIRGEDGMLSGADAICVRNNPGADNVANLNAWKGLSEEEVMKNYVKDLKKYDCSLDPVSVDSASNWLGMK